MSPEEIAREIADAYGGGLFLREAIATAIRAAEARGAERMRERAAEAAASIKAPKSIGRGHGRHHEAGARHAAAAILALEVGQ